MATSGHLTCRAAGRLLSGFAFGCPRAVSARTHHTASLLEDGQVLVAGGVNETGTLAEAELFDPAQSPPTWTPASAMRDKRTGHIAERLPNGRVLVAGGTGENGPLDTAEVYECAATQPVIKANATPAPSRRARRWRAPASF
jgi:hypothetical protein